MVFASAVVTSMILALPPASQPASDRPLSINVESVGGNSVSQPDETGSTVSAEGANRPEKASGQLSVPEIPKQRQGETRADYLLRVAQQPGRDSWPDEAKSAADEMLLTYMDVNGPGIPEVGYSEWKDGRKIVTFYQHTSSSPLVQVIVNRDLESGEDEGSRRIVRSISRTDDGGRHMVIDVFSLDGEFQKTIEHSWGGSARPKGG